MITFIIIAAIVFAATLIAGITLSQRRTVEDSGSQFINEDGLHIYYDRHIIRRNDGTSELQIKINPMKKHINQPPRNLSYYGLSLLSFLKENHPNRITDYRFIESRSDMAAEVYSLTIKDGGTHTQAEEEASIILYRGLHFSPYTTLVNIIQEEFVDQLPEERVRDFALELLPLCTDLLAEYDLKDDFDDTPQYNSLYSELTAVVSEHLNRSTR